MSERQYFALRYAIPGYTFILLVIGINYAPLLEIQARYGFDGTFGTFLAFLSLLSGSAIGFLVSQVWWFRFQWKVSILGIREYGKSVEAISEIYGLQKPKCDKTEQRRFLAVIDYISYSCAEEKVLTLSERRWDMYHTLSSTICSLGIGVVVGILCRIYCEFTVFNASFLILCNAAAKAEAGALIGIFVIVVFLIFILWKAKHWIAIMSASLYEARIRSSGVTPDKLKKAFPDFFREKETHT